LTIYFELSALSFTQCAQRYALCDLLLRGPTFLEMKPPFEMPVDKPGPKALYWRTTARLDLKIKSTSMA